MAESTVAIMGVLNTTPDSFSDGGKYESIEAAIAQARLLVSQGATIIDVGGESTRPGATLIPREVELARVIPVVRALAADGVTVSIDTLHAETAAAAVHAGAHYINDVSGGLHDPLMLETAAKAGRETGALFVIGHWRGIPAIAHERSTYGDVVTEVRDELAARAQAAIDAGVHPSRIVLDPGLGFDKTSEQCWEILRRLGELRQLGYPVLIGASRKRMVIEALAGVPEAAQVRGSRDHATGVASAFAARAGAWGVRVHDVAATVTALAIERAWTGVDGAAAVPVSPAVPFLPAAQPAALPTDRITLTGLEVFAHHGVFDFERENGQKFFIDAEVAVDLRPASAGDDLSSTVHYGELAEAIVAAVERDPVDLIETVAERVVDVALSFPAVAQARITVHKPDAPIEFPFADVSVTVVRDRPAETHTGDKR